MGSPGPVFEAAAAARSGSFHSHGQQSEVVASRVAPGSVPMQLNPCREPRSGARHCVESRGGERMCLPATLAAKNEGK